MLTFDDYSLQQQNQYVDIVFTAPVYGVFDDATWALGWPMNNANPPNASDYFEFKIQENFFIILFISIMPILTGFVFYKGYKVIK